MTMAAITFFVALTLVGSAAMEDRTLPTSSASSPVVSDSERSTAASAPGEVAPVGALGIGAVKTALMPDSVGSRFIVIGGAMTLKELHDRQKKSRYPDYLKQWIGRPAGFSRDWYVATSGGVTSVNFSGVTGRNARYLHAEVPKDLVRQIGFASPLWSVWKGESVDLVAVQVWQGYGSWVTHLLCSEKAANFAACKAQYRLGIFQTSDGREVDDAFNLIEGGAKIDSVTFKR